MKSEGERYECPWENCGAFHLLLPNGLLPVHTVAGKSVNCPGGGFNTRVGKGEELRKMQTRARAAGMA